MRIDLRLKGLQFCLRDQLLHLSIAKLLNLFDYGSPESR